MPRLPDYTALGERPTPSPARGVASYSPADPTTFSRGMTAAGREMEQAANIIAATNDRQDRMVAEAALNQLQARRLELEMGDDGFQNVRGAGAVGQRFVETYGQKFKDAETSISQGLENENQRRMFQQRVPMAQMQYRAALLKHQAQETDRFNTKTEEDTIELARRQIFNAAGDPMALEAGLAQINWAIDQRGRRMGWGADTVSATKAKFTEAIMEDMASMMVERDPFGALAALNTRLGIGPTGPVTVPPGVSTSGMVEQGNIDLSTRPRVKNADGSTSTVRSMGVNIDGVEVLIPTVSDDGRIMSDEEAIQQYRKTGRHLGKFKTAESAESYAEALHQSEARKLTGPRPSGVTAIDAVDPQKLVELRHRAASYVAQADNKLKAENEKRMREAETAAKELQSFVLTGQMVSAVYEREVLTKVGGTPYEAAAREMVNASYTGVTHGSLPLPAQEQKLRALEALMTATGSSPEDSKLANQARQITETQRAAYKENPWAAATRFGRQQPVPEAQITAPEQIPQLIAQRLPLMSGVETFAGRSVSPLQPGEAKAFAEQLAKLVPEAKAEVLGQTGAMLSAPRVAALADQLDKKDRPLALSLKLGVDRTNAGRVVSELVLRGAQALSDKTIKKDDEAITGWRSEIASMVRGTLSDQQAENDVIDSAWYVMAAQNIEGVALPTHTRGIGKGVKDALGMVIGTPLERGGFKTFMPRGMTERQFDDKLKVLANGLQGFARPEGTDLQRAPSKFFFVRGTPVPVEQIASRLTEYGLKRDGAGNYIPIVRNAPVTLDPQGRNLLRLEVR